MKRLRSMLLVITAAAMGVSALWVGAAQASEPAPREARVIVLDDQIIEGRPHRPEAFYLLSRTSPDYELPALRPRFVDEVRRSVRGAPF